MYLDNYKSKNNITPHVVKDFFTKEELDEILNIVKNQKVDEFLEGLYKPLILPNMSRMQIEIVYPEIIKKKLENFASKIAGEELIMSHNSYLSYNKIHGKNVNPKLPPHFDSDNYYSKVTLDYQLDKNIDWPIRIEEDEFNLEYGDLLIFWGSGTVHWREPIIFNDGDNTEVLTMHFSKKEDYEELNVIARSVEEREKRLNFWRLNPKYNKYHVEYADKNLLLNK
jgi:hypothetical protein